MPRRQQIRRKVRLLTRRLQPRPHWSTAAPSAGHKCPTPRPSSSILRANTPSPPCLLSWWTSRHELLTDPEPEKTIHNDHGLNLESLHLKDVEDEHWDPSVFMDNMLRWDVLRTYENKNDGTQVHQQPTFLFIMYTAGRPTNNK